MCVVEACSPFNVVGWVDDGVFAFFCASSSLLPFCARALEKAEGPAGVTACLLGLYAYGHAHDWKFDINFPFPFAYR